MADRFFIAPYDQNSGQQNNVKPWLIPDEAFQELLNAYVFRGRVRKRFGSRWIGETSLQSRFRIQVGVITSGAFAGNVRTINADSTMPTATGQGFSVLDTFFTVSNAAAGIQQMLRSDGTADTATYNLTDSAFNLTVTGAPDTTPVYFYPSFPVMGLLTYEQSTINDEFIIGFDTRYAYQYSNGWSRLATETTAGAAVWTGTNAQFFWGTTWLGADASAKIFFVTNFNENEPNYIRQFNGTAWDDFRPALDTTVNYLNSARIIVPFKNRLVALNTWEGTGTPGTNYPNRARYSQVGSPLDASAWLVSTPGRGNAIDASTTEAIVSVEFIKDRLIVYFERSTWELVDTRNQAYPFTWQKINTELGVESTFSIIPFDKVAVGVGNVGIHACNGTSVQRIDGKIPDTVFNIHNDNSGIFRVYGIRDYYVEMMYWTFPDTNTNSDFPYPNKVLIYNYATGTWAFNDDSITVFGYFQPVSGILWSSTTVVFNDSVPWNSGANQAKFRQVVAGNQQGYTFVIDPDFHYNASVLQITNITVASNIVTVTAIDHNLRGEDYAHFSGITDDGNLSLINDKIFKIINTAANPVSANAFSFIYEDDVPSTLAGTYSGGGLISRVSNIVVSTKEYNFYANKGRNVSLLQVDFMVDSTEAGEIDVEFFVSTAIVPLLQDSITNGAIVGTGTLDTYPYTNTASPAAAPVPFEETAKRLWHTVYLQADGQAISLKLTLNDTQMKDTDIRLCDFQLHAMSFTTLPTSYDFQ